MKYFLKVTLTGVFLFLLTKNIARQPAPAGPAIIKHARPTPFQPEAITASISDGLLELQWISPAGSNSIEYGIEGSTDGMLWERLGTVSGGEQNPVPGIPQHYRFRFTDNGTALAGIAFLLMLLLVPATPDKKIRRILILVLSLGFITGSGYIGRAIRTSRQINYVRILELDEKAGCSVSGTIATHPLLSSK